MNGVSRGWWDGREGWFSQVICWRHEHVWLWTLGGWHRQRGGQEEGKREEVEDTEENVGQQRWWAPHTEHETSFPIAGIYVVAGIMRKPRACVLKGFFIESDVFGPKIIFPHSEFTFLKPREYYFHYQSGKIKRFMISNVKEGTWKSVHSGIFWGEENNLIVGIQT